MVVEGYLLRVAGHCETNRLLNALRWAADFRRQRFFQPLEIVLERLVLLVNREGDRVAG